VSGRDELWLRTLCLDQRIFVFVDHILERSRRPQRIPLGQGLLSLADSHGITSLGNGQVSGIHGYLPEFSIRVDLTSIGLLIPEGKLS